MRVNLKILFVTLLVIACDSSSSSTSKRPGPTDEPPPIEPIKGQSTPELGEGQTDPSQEENPGLTTAGETLLPQGLSISRTQYLSQLGDDLAERAASFQARAESLAAAAVKYCDSRSEADLQDTRDQWKVSMGGWQHFEVFQLGPVWEASKELKYDIYNWPDGVDHCNIEKEALRVSKLSSDRLANYKVHDKYYTRKGMGTLEYLLFETSFDSQCLDPKFEATKVEWNKLEGAKKVDVRCAYLKPVAQAIAVHGKDLADRWGVPGDNYLSHVLQPGDETREHEMLQRLYEGFFYVDLEVKNQKMAAPAGLDAKHCESSPIPCPERAEFRFADFNREAIDANLKAMIDLFFGPNGETRQGGFSALVRGQGGAAVADRTEADLEELAKVIETEKGLSLSQLTAEKGSEDCKVSAVSWLCKTRALIRRLATELKGEYAQILKVTPPAAAAGDND